MENKDKPLTSKYLQIAYEIAHDIIIDKFHLGQKISGRSLLSSHYQVSSETIRKALSILESNNVIHVVDKVGVYIKSKEAAELFVETNDSRIKNGHQISDLKTMILQSIAIHEKMLDSIKYLQHTPHMKNLWFETFAIDVDDHQKWTFKEIGKIDLYQQTRAIIIGIKYQGTILKNPEFKTIILPKMTLLILGDDAIKSSVESWLNT